MNKKREAALQIKIVVRERERVRVMTRNKRKRERINTRERCQEADGQTQRIKSTTRKKLKGK